MEVESKTSDEILEELFSALNVPLSPKAEKEPPPENQDNSAGDSEGSEDKEADSKSCDSEEEPSKGQEEDKLAKNHKHKTSKKKKEKKKKKKKHKKKDDDNRHKSKKKHKKSSVSESGEDNNFTALKPDVEEVTGQVCVVDLEQPEKPVDGCSEKVGSNNHNTQVEDIQITPKSKSPKSEEESDKSPSSISKGKNGTISDSGNKDEPAKKLSKKVKSPQRSHSSSKSLRSRSRSTSRARHRQSRSRSQSRTKNSSRQSGSRHSARSRSRSLSRTKNDSRRSKSKHGIHSRSRSRSRTKNRQSRSRSKTKSSSEYKSKAKSPHESEKLRRKRKSSRSHSKSPSPRSSKRQRYSRSHSRSPISRSARKRSSRSFSKSMSPKTSRRKKHPRSRSPTPAKTSSKYRSRSRSGSRKRTSQLRETLEGSAKVEPCKDQKSVIEIDLSSIPTPDVQQCPSTLPISLESIPLPVPPVSSGVQDPSSIPLPQPVISGSDLPNGSEGIDVKSSEIDIGTIPVPGSIVETPVKEQEPVKPADTGTEKSKAKTIIIKSLKDSLIYMQAQEEAERRAKVKHDDEPEPIESKEEENDEGETDTKVEDDKDQLQEQQEEETQIEKDDEEEKGDETKEPEEIEAAVVKKSKEAGQYEMEDGEIVSENDETPKTKSHKKKLKKDKEKNKEKKKSKKDKSKEKKKSSKEKSGSKERSVRSRSKSKERSKHKRSSRSWHRERDVDRRHRRYSRSRSPSRDRHSRFRRRSYSRSRSRSKSRSGRRRDCVTDLRDKVTRKRLLEIARRNAVDLMQNGCLPPSVEQEQLVKIKTGGKSVEELTDFCKQLVATGNYSDADLSDPSLSSDEDNDNPDKPFSYTRHPFNVRDIKPILMNIRNAPMLPTKTNAERLADHAKLREQFPVSSGSQHRNKGEVCIIEEKIRTADSGWVPVSPKEKKPKEEDSVFSKEKTPSVDISQIVSSRLSAMRKLQDNPHDIEALKTLHNVQKEMQTWALSKQEPGQFTGSTGVKILSQEELCAGQQAWVRKVEGIVKDGFYSLFLAQGYTSPRTVVFQVSTCQIHHDDVVGMYLSYQDAALHRWKIPENLGHYQGPD